MTTYLYAPKDDLKHRALWRDLYTPEETGSFCLLSHRKTKNYNSFSFHDSHYNTYLNNHYCFVENLKQLIASSKEYGIKFYYALSPGLDILFSSTRDIQQLKRKMSQVLVFSLLNSKNVENTIIYRMVCNCGNVCSLLPWYSLLPNERASLPPKNSFISCHSCFMSHGYFEMCCFIL